MLGIGEELRKAREEQGIDLDDVIEKTNLKRDFILALENEEYEKLPTLIHAKGFLKTYANYLGLDGDEMGRAFSAIESELRQGRERKPIAVPQKVQHNIDWKEARMEFWDYLKQNTDKIRYVIVLVIILFVGYRLGVFAWQKGRPTWHKWTTAATSKWSSWREGRPAKTSSEGTPVKKETNEVKGLPMVTIPADFKAAPATNAAPTGGESVVPMAFEGELLTLELRVLGNVWASVMVDDELIYDGILNAGGLEQWDAEESITIKASDMSRLQLKVNGKALEDVAKASQSIKKIHISRKGVEMM